MRKFLRIWLFLSIRIIETIIDERFPRIMRRNIFGFLIFEGNK
jgi:hypothetical protein